MTENKEVAMKATMYYWKLNNINGLIGSSISDNDIQKVSGLINTGDPDIIRSKINGITERESFTESFYSILP